MMPQPVLQETQEGDNHRTRHNFRLRVVPLPVDVNNRRAGWVCELEELKSHWEG